MSYRHAARRSVALATCLSVGLWLGCAGSGSGGTASGGSGSVGSGVGGTGTGTGGISPGVGGTGTGTGGISSGVGGASGAGGTAAGGATAVGGGAGTGGTGGTSGAGGSAGGGVAGSGAAVNPCSPRAGLLFCDTFEADTPGAPPAPWTTSIIGSGTVTVDGTSPAHSGTRSVHIQDTTDDYDTLLALHDAAILPSTTGRFYVRFYIRLAAPMTMGHNSFVLGDLYASPGSGNFLRFSEDNQMIAESIMGDGQGAMSNNGYYGDGKIGVGFAAGQWTCVELLLDNTAPEIDVWVNDVEVPDLHSTAWKIDAYDYLRFGFEKYAGPASEIWYDDIAIGTQKIGCN
jgi:hypothetical protein